MRKIKIALWSYKEDYDIQGVTIEKIEWTGFTLRITMSDGHKLYGVYSELPKVESRLKEDLFTTYGFTSTNILADCWDKIEVDSMYTSQQQHYQKQFAYLRLKLKYRQQQLLFYKFQCCQFLCEGY